MVKAARQAERKANVDSARVSKVTLQFHQEDRRCTERGFGNGKVKGTSQQLVVFLLSWLSRIFDRLKFSRQLWE